jgi:RND family efflux transporter MFP subunit
VSVEANLKLANSELARAKKLFAQSAISREELDVITNKQAVASSDIVKAKAAIKQAGVDLERTRIYAPISGRISNTKVTKGNTIKAADKVLTTIVSVDPIYVEFSVDERSLLRYAHDAVRWTGRTSLENLKALNIPVELALSDDQGFQFKDGKLDFVDNRVNPKTGTMLVRAVFPNATRILTPGLYAKVRIKASEPYRALLINERAIGTDQGLKYVYVVNNKKIVERRDVTLGSFADGLRVVSQGLKPDDWVIVNGTQRVRPDIEVKGDPVKMPGWKEPPAVRIFPEARNSK